MDKKTSFKFNVIAILAIIIFCIALSPVSLQNDTFYTVKIGEYVLQNGVTMEEPFAWHEGLEYTFPHWAYDVFIYLMFNLGGQWGIYISTVVLACILGIAIYLVNSKLSKNRLMSFLITLGVMYLLRNFIAARAQLVTFILFISTIYCIEMFLKTRKKRYAVFLLIIPTIIANVHLAVWPVYFIFFLPYIAEYIIAYLSDFDIRGAKRKLKKLKIKIEKAGQDEATINNIKEEILAVEEKINKITEKKQKNKENAYKIVIEKNDATKILIIIFILAMFTGLLTPTGLTPYEYLPQTLQGNTTDNISEHLPLTLVQDKDFMCVLILTLTLVIFTNVKLRAKDWFMLAGLFFLAFQSRRQASLLFLICSPIMTRMVSYLIEKYDEPGSVEKAIKNIVSVCGTIITISVILIVSMSIVKPKTKQVFVSESNYPVKACDYIVNNIDVSKMKIFNEYNYGSYLLFRGIPVFIDSRADLYTPEFNDDANMFQDFLDVVNLNTDYENKFNQYDITHVILYKNSRLAKLLDKDDNYNKLYGDNNFVFYERLSA